MEMMGAGLGDNEWSWGNSIECVMILGSGGIPCWEGSVKMRDMKEGVLGPWFRNAELVKGMLDDDGNDKPPSRQIMAMEKIRTVGPLSCGGVRVHKDHRAALSS
ncbi:hypothetical protein V6N11_058475 [Hibiscus sabdariffa]|uniref:Uncharacterized protein n=1 Tax=Hibiscus sabdariffa TaxID=183260 RepID=A0ABR2U4B7_9ROSI